MTPRRRKPVYASEADLPGVEHEDVTLSNGKVFRLRGLTLGEVREALTDTEDGTATVSIVAACTVDPKISPERLAAWLDTAPAGDARRMTEAAYRLCGMGEGATKSGVSADRDGSEPGE